MPIDASMSTMLVEIYDALKEAGASEEKACAAAASLTGRNLLKWMNGIVIAGVAALIIKGFFP
jgi:hypothetical protein